MLNHKIQPRVEAFVKDLTKIIADSALEQVQEALGVVGAAARVAPKRLGRAPIVVPGAKRAPDVIAAQTEALFAHVKAHPGQRIEQIADGMGVTTKELVLPVKKLAGDSRIKTKGVKRATTYFPR